MSERSIARRYAAALFDVTHQAGSDERAERDLAGLSQLISGHAELSRVLASPAVPASAKRDVVAALLDAAGGVTPEVRRTALLLAERDRLAELPSVSMAFAERVLDAKRIVRADVVTAAPLSDASRAALAAALGRATGKSVTISERLDANLIGGVVARVGSFVYDGSVTRQLERLKQQLTTDN